MPGRLLLDTSVIIDLFAGDPGVARGFADAEEVFVPVVAIGELLYGALRSARRAANMAQVQAFAAATVVLRCDVDTAAEYARIKDELRAKVRPLPENDVWIAALARQHGLTVATRDRHFGEIADLRVAAWKERGPWPTGPAKPALRAPTGSDGRQWMRTGPDSCESGPVCVPAVADRPRGRSAARARSGWGRSGPRTP